MCLLLGKVCSAEGSWLYSHITEATATQHKNMQVSHKAQHDNLKELPIDLLLGKLQRHAKQLTV